MVAVIDYNAGNVTSVAYALRRLGQRFELTDDADKIAAARKVIFPGVGEASTTMRFLKKQRLDALLPELEQPLLGICLGMQIMCEYTEENNTTCLGIFPQKVKRLSSGNGLKIPHMGWNKIQLQGSTSFLPGDLEGKHCYFVHSFYVETGDSTVATTEYGLRFSAVLQRDNFYATQFHPEKSGLDGERILKAFLNL